MKPIFYACLLLSTAGLLIAGEDKSMIGKFQFVHVGADQQRTEVAAQSLIDGQSAVIPLVLPSKTIWICSVEVEPGSQTASFNVVSADATSGGEPVQGAKPPLQILQMTLPLKNGEEVVLVKSTGFTLTATVTLSATLPSPDAGATQTETGAQALTEAELKRVEVKPNYDPGHERIRLVGYNPFENSLRKGVLRVILPKTAETPESTRDYAFTLNGAGLADFSGEIRAALEIPQGTKPLFQLVKLEFAQ
jgi:hypothetical protein